jgi:hypothetical protein
VDYARRTATASENLLRTTVNILNKLNTPATGSGAVWS